MIYMGWVGKLSGSMGRIRNMVGSHGGMGHGGAWYQNFWTRCEKWEFVAKHVLVVVAVVAMVEVVEMVKVVAVVLMAVAVGLQR